MSTKKKSAVRIDLQNSTPRPFVNFWGEDFELDLPAYQCMEEVVGVVFVTLGKKRKLEFTGIKLELVGRIEMQTKAPISDFVCVSRDLAYPGTLTAESSFPFSFARVEKPYDSYYGSCARVRYSLKVCVSRNYRKNLTAEVEIAVVSPPTQLPELKSIRLEVGIEQFLHIDFEFTRNSYCITDCLLGKIFFLMVRLPIRKMDIVLKRKETVYQGAENLVEVETVGRFEIMDGEPRRGECVPVRLFLGSYPLSPTYVDVNKKFSVRYFISLVVSDDSDRCYFKQTEIHLYRSLSS